MFPYAFWGAGSGRAVPHSAEEAALGPAPPLPARADMAAVPEEQGGLKHREKHKNKKKAAPGEGGMRDWRLAGRAVE